MLYLHNLIEKFDSCKNDINFLFNKFIDTIYDENDDFFEILFKNNNDIGEELNDNEEELDSLKYTSEDLTKKFKGIHLYKESYKNKDESENIFEDDYISGKKKYINKNKNKNKITSIFKNK